MSKPDRAHIRNGGPAVERSSSLSIGLMLGAVLVGMALTMLFVFLTWIQTRDLQNDLNTRFSGIENRLAQLSTKVEQGARAAAAPQRGPDPNRVYTIKTDGAPFKGRRDAPVTIVAFSEFQ